MLGSFTFCPRSSNLRLAVDGLDKSPRFRCPISETVSQPEGAVGIRQSHSSSREGAIREARRRAGGVRVLLWSGFCRGGRHGTEGIPKTASRRDFGSANAGRVFIPRCSKRFVQPGRVKRRSRRRSVGWEEQAPLHFCFNDRFLYERKQMTLDVVTWKLG